MTSLLPSTFTALNHCFAHLLTMIGSIIDRCRCRPGT